MKLTFSQPFRPPPLLPQRPRLQPASRTPNPPPLHHRQLPLRSIHIQAAIHLPQYLTNNLTQPHRRQQYEPQNPLTNRQQTATSPGAGNRNVNSRRKRNSSPPHRHLAQHQHHRNKHPSPLRFLRPIPQPQPILPHNPGQGKSRQSREQEHAYAFACAQWAWTCGERCGEWECWGEWWEC